MLVIKGRYVRTHPISDGCQPSVIHEKYLKFEGCLPAEQCRPFWPWSTNQPTVFQVRHWPHSTLDPRRLLSSASLDCRWNSVRGPFSSQLDIKGMPARQHGGCEPGRTCAAAFIPRTCSEQSAICFSYPSIRPFGQIRFSI